MTGPTGRSRKTVVLPPKIEKAFVGSETRRDSTRTSREDYASGYEDGYRDAVEEIRAQTLRMSRELLKP
jgi:hypothetical protein